MLGLHGLEFTRVQAEQPQDGRGDLGGLDPVVDLLVPVDPSAGKENRDVAAAGAVTTTNPAVQIAAIRIIARDIGSPPYDRPDVGRETLLVPHNVQPATPT